MNYKHFALYLSIAAVLGSCSYSRHPDSIFYDKNDPGHEYASQMYHSWPYEPLTQVTDPSSGDYNSMPFNDYGGALKQNEITPVEGTIARGKLDYYYPYPNSNEGYEQAGTDYTNPIPLDISTLNEGDRLYHLYCDHCHGEHGAGNGTLVQIEKFPSPGAYNDRHKDLPAGKIYHTIVYGKNLMGSHASQLSPDQRWMIIHYVEKLQKITGEEEPSNEEYLANLQTMDIAIPMDSTATDSTAADEAVEEMVQEEMTEEA